MILLQATTSLLIKLTLEKWSHFRKRKKEKEKKCKQKKICSLRGQSHKSNSPKTSDKPYCKHMWYIFFLTVILQRSSSYFAILKITQNMSAVWQQDFAYWFGAILCDIKCSSLPQLHNRTIASLAEEVGNKLLWTSTEKLINISLMVPFTCEESIS